MQLWENVTVMRWSRRFGTSTTICAQEREQKALQFLRRLPRQETGMLPVYWPGATAEHSTCGADMIFRRTTIRRLH